MEDGKRGARELRHPSRGRADLPPPQPGSAGLFALEICSPRDDLSFPKIRRQWHEPMGKSEGLVLEYAGP